METLPTAGIIAEVERLGPQLCALATAQRDVSLAQLETGVLDRMRAALPGLLQAVLQANQHGVQTPAAHWRQTCPQCGQRARVARWRVRRLRTVCGPIQWERPWYHCRRCHHGFSPVDATLGVAARRRLSATLTNWVVEQGATTSFAEAAATLARLTGLEVSAETIRQTTEAVGTALETQAPTDAATVQRTQEAAGPVEPVPGQLVVETDGVMVRYLDGWHEVKAGLVAGVEQGALQAVSYIAARATAEAFGPRLLAEAARRGALEEIGWTGPVTRRGLAILPEVVVLGDGAHWIWDVAADHFGTRTEIVDFYHATEHLWNAAHALYPDDASAAQDWAQQRRHALRTAGAAPVLEAFRTAMAPTDASATVLRTEHGYFRTNATRMDYPAFHARGFSIGSGAIESAAKHLVQLRLKRPGARWAEAGAQAVLQVRCHLASHRPLAA